MVGLVLTFLMYVVIAIFKSSTLSFETFWGNIKNEGIQGNLLSLLLAIAIVLVVMFLYYALLKVPHKLYLTEKAEKEKLQTELNKLKGGKEPDIQSLLKGIEYVLNNTKFGQKITRDEAFQEVKRLAIGSRITIWGRLKEHFVEYAYDWASKIPADFLENCIYKNHGDFKTSALVEQPTESDKWEKGQNPLTFLSNRKGMRIYYEPTISMAEIKKRFDD